MDRVKEIKDEIVPNLDVNIVYVNTDVKINIDKYTDDAEMIQEYNSLKNNDFYGLFAIPGTKDTLTIFINKDIINTDQFYNTLTHELYHCLFYINNRALFEESDYSIGYKTCDEIFARFSGYKYCYEHQICIKFIFDEDDSQKLERIILRRFMKDSTWYEFISLFANVLFFNKVRKIQVNYFNAFKNTNREALGELIEIFEQIDFYNITLDNIKCVDKCIRSLF